MCPLLGLHLQIEMENTVVVSAMRKGTKLEDEKNGDSQHLPCFRFCSSFGDFSLCRIYKGGCVEMRVCIMGV